MAVSNKTNYSRSGSHQRTYQSRSRTNRTSTAQSASGSYSRRSRKNKKYKKEKNINWNFIRLIVVMVILAFAVKLTLNSGVIEKSALYLSTVSMDNDEDENEKILSGITVGGIDVSDLTYSQAAALLAKEVDTVLEGNAVVIKSSDGSKTYTYGFDDFGIYFDVERALRSAISYNQAQEEWTYNEKALTEGTVDFPVYFYNTRKINSYVNAIASENNVESQNAQCEKINGEFVITPSVVGYKMDSEALYDQIIETLDSRNFGQELSFELTVDQPKYHEDDFAYIDNQLSSFTSNYTGGDDNRIQNLRVGCEKINGTILYPDEVFSTNDKFNPCTEENGWANAATIVNGKLEDSIGGGMCQVSSALYDAVLYAELEVVERQNHSLKVGYAKYAFDATLAGDYIDLKFKNNTGYPLYIESYLTSSQVVVKIYGYDRYAGTNREVVLENKFIEETQPEDPIITYDPEMPEGTEEITVTALAGQKYELYKKIYINGVLTETVKVNTSTYKPRREEKTVGQKKAEDAAETTTVAAEETV